MLLTLIAYGKAGLAEAKHRLAICDLAIQSNKYLMLTDWEAKQGDWTPTKKVAYQII